MPTMGQAPFEVLCRYNLTQFSYRLYDLGNIIILILQMRKLQHREAKELAHGHSAHGMTSRVLVRVSG